MDEVHVDYDELGDSFGFRISFNKVKQEVDGIGSFESTSKDVLSVWERVFHGHGSQTSDRFISDHPVPARYITCDSTVDEQKW